MQSKSSPFSFAFLTEVLASPRVKPLVRALRPATVLEVVRGVFDDVSQETLAAASELRAPDVPKIVEKIVARLTALGDEAEPITIDARGRIFPDDRERLAAEAIEEESWRLVEGRDERTVRDEAAREKVAIARLCQATGAEAAAIFSNREAARVATLEALAERVGREVVVARRDLYERENGERLERSFDYFSTVVRREVGACNAVDVGDYASAVSEKTGIVWTTFGRWSPAGRRTSAAELAKLRATGKTSFAIFGEIEFAPLIDLTEFFDSAIPTVGERLKSGFDLVLCSGAQLIGGPNCGLLFGSRAFVEPIARSRTAAFSPVGRVRRAALEKTLELCESRETALASIPALRTLSTSLANLTSRAERLAALLTGCPSVAEARAVEGRSTLCANATFGTSPTRLVEIRPKGFSPAELAVRLESESPRVLARWTRDALLLDVKTIEPERDLVVVELFERLTPPTVEERPTAR